MIKKITLLALVVLSTTTIFFSCQSKLPDDERQSLLKERDSLKSLIKSNDEKYLVEKDSLIGELNRNKEDLRIVKEEKSKIDLHLSYRYWQSEHWKARADKKHDRKVSPFKGDIDIYGDEFAINTNDIVSGVDFKGQLVKELPTKDGQYFKYEIIITQRNEDKVNIRATLEHIRHTNGKTFIRIEYSNMSHIYGLI